MENWFGLNSFIWNLLDVKLIKWKTVHYFNQEQNRKLSDMTFHSEFMEVTTKFWWKALRSVSSYCTAPVVEIMNIICPPVASSEIENEFYLCTSYIYLVWNLKTQKLKKNKIYLGVAVHLGIQYSVLTLAGSHEMLKFCSHPQQDFLPI